MELLEPGDRARVAAFIVNRFRGDVSLLKPGLDFLEERTGVPVLGVVPYIPRLRLADEDALSLEARLHRRPARQDEIEVAVVRLPLISNYDEFEPLEHEPGVVVRFVDEATEVVDADLVILPGSKSTMADLAWLRESGLPEAIHARSKRGAPVLGICGGCQMLTQRIDDPDHVESTALTSASGLGLLEARTRFARQKTTSRVVARPSGRGFFAEDVPRDARLGGYEIHMGRLEATDANGAVFEVLERNGKAERSVDGAVGCGGAVVGTMIHGLFENDSLRAGVLRALRRRKGIADPVSHRAIPTKEQELDRLARVVRESIDEERFGRIVGL
jgi:adenosylcobyric acid synthase